jgi:para-nitrobenzyl esterase
MLKALCILSGLALASGQEELLVQTTSGLVQGYYNGMKVREWDGIRYAAPPVGAKRWEQSTPAEPWADVFMADFMAPACPQVCVLPPGTCPLYGTDEDCLYLTVMGPTDNATDTSGWPVYFWIHGGSYEQGSGNTPLYNGTQFALQGVITVVVNYRLSSLGFLASTSMEGNYGLRDQVLALQWVRDNIAAFGGNPAAITIGGQSAGGMSVGAFLTAPSTGGMFSRAIMESNPLALPFHTRYSLTYLS